MREQIRQARYSNPNPSSPLSEENFAVLRAEVKQFLKEWRELVKQQRRKRREERKARRKAKKEERRRKKREKKEAKKARRQARRQERRTRRYGCGGEIPPVGPGDSVSQVGATTGGVGFGAAQVRSAPATPVGREFPRSYPDSPPAPPPPPRPAPDSNPPTGSQAKYALLSDLEIEYAQKHSELEALHVQMVEEVDREEKERQQKRAREVEKEIEALAERIEKVRTEADEEFAREVAAQETAEVVRGRGWW